MSPPARSGDLAVIRRILDHDGVVLMPTDTLPGFHARLDRPAAIARITGIKGRDGAKPFLVLAASTRQVANHLEWTDRTSSLAERLWPGPFTLILPAGLGTPVEVTSETGSMAVRVPADQELRSLLTLVGVPLVSTSVNRSGQAPATTLDEAVSAFGGDVDLIAELSASGDGTPSTLLDLTCWPPVVVRAGAGVLPEWWMEL